MMRVVIAAAALSAVAISAAPPRLADGRPDLQGIWSTATMTPLQRPKEFSGKPYFTKEEAAEWIAHARDRQIVNFGKVNIETTGEEPEVWGEPQPLVPDLRTALVVDPPDGVIPLRPEVRARIAAEAKAREQRRFQYDGPEDFDTAERCLMEPRSVPPLRSQPYNSHFQIVQTPRAVMILSEMIHDARVIPTDGTPHLPPQIRRWQGDSRGRWEGDTLVVDTTNFLGQTQLFGSGDGRHVVERFTRVDADTLLYRYTVDDSETFTQPWTAEVPLRSVPGPIYEYACHEANYSIVNALRSARAQQGDR
jgi:hypothetical protein